MKKLIFIFAIFYTFCSFSQSNLEKYWFYRNRLTNYFVKVGPNVGESIVAERLNDSRLDKYKIGDGTIDLAWYISVLASEYALLKNNNQNTDRSLLELYYAMLAYERLDKCEDKEPWNKAEAKLDGFFNREEIRLYTDSSAFSLKGRNTNLSKSDKWGKKAPGMPTYIKEIDAFYSLPVSKGVAMSQDQAVHLLMGFALIVRSFDNQNVNFIDLQGQKQSVNFYVWAQKLSHLIITYIKKDNWIIKDPNGDKVQRGQNAIANSYGFAKAGKYITGKNYQNAVSFNPLEAIFWNGQIIPNWENPYNTTMAMTLAAIGGTWNFPVGTANSLQMAGSTWRKNYLYVLLYEYLYQTNVKSLSADKITEMLNTAPKYGTYFWGNENFTNFACCDTVSGNPGGGWASTNRFRNSKNAQDFGVENDKANFNGLDYMLLYNMYHLNQNTEPYKYILPKY